VTPGVTGMTHDVRSKATGNEQVATHSGRRRGCLNNKGSQYRASRQYPQIQHDPKNDHAE